jgi:hypothetical protein
MGEFAPRVRAWDESWHVGCSSDGSITLLVNLNRRAYKQQDADGLSHPSGGRVHMHNSSDHFGGKSNAGGSRGGVNVQTLTNVHFDEATVYEPAQVRSPAHESSVQRRWPQFLHATPIARCHRLPLEAPVCGQGRGAKKSLLGYI